jgi:hypothetical protein
VLKLHLHARQDRPCCSRPPHLHIRAHSEWG